MLAARSGGDFPQFLVALEKSRPNLSSRSGIVPTDVINTRYYLPRWLVCAGINLRPSKPWLDWLQTWVSALTLTVQIVHMLRYLEQALNVHLRCATCTPRATQRNDATGFAFAAEIDTGGEVLVTKPYYFRDIQFYEYLYSN